MARNPKPIRLKARRELRLARAFWRRVDGFRADDAFVVGLDELDLYVDCALLAVGPDCALVALA